MAIAKIADRGSALDKTNATTLPITLASGGSITVGNYLILRLDLGYSLGAAPTITVTDPRSNTWTVLPKANSAGAAAYIAYTKIVNAYSNGDVITPSCGTTSDGSAGIIEEWSGIDATTPVAVSTVTATGVGTTPSGSITPTAAGQLVYGCLGIEGDRATSYVEDTDTTSGSWAALTAVGTTGGTDSSNSTAAGGYKLVTASGAQTWDPTYTTSADWSVVLVGFAPAAVGGGAARQAQPVVANQAALIRASL